ncbi:hypothetical protein HJFPF1_03543 [Paramyrothecium foliicola]|nr:hypothetical protein HJFPF1_03543 [Paramyrothecium foliicola]
MTRYKDAENPSLLGLSNAPSWFFIVSFEFTVLGFCLSPFELSWAARQSMKTTMASMGAASVDYQALIHSNCLTFLGDDVDVYINSQVEDSGTWTVHVLKVEDGKRSAVFSESSAALTSALEAVHKKSAMAVNQYVKTNGFGLVPRVSSRRSALRRGRSGRLAALGDSEILSLDSGSSSTSEEEEDDLLSDSDVSIDDSLHGRALQRSGRRAMSRPHMSARRPKPLGNGMHFQGNYDRHVDSLARPPQIPYIPYHPIGLPPARPLPPPSSASKGIPLPPPMLHPPPPPPRPAAPPAHRIHALPPRPETRALAEPVKRGVLLCITWKGHGDLNVVDDCLLSISSIQIRTLQLVRMRAVDFRDTASVDFASVVLQAQIKRLHVAGRAYELGNFRDNLAELFAGFAGFPRVEVEVISAPTPPPSESASQTNSQNSN